MHLALYSRSVFSVVITFLRTPLAPTIAIAVAAAANFGGASAAGLMGSSEEIPDQIVPGSITSDQVTPLDAFGHFGGLFEARFYQAHVTADDPRDKSGRRRLCTAWIWP